MNKYELCIIFRANLEEEAYKTDFDKVLAYIERFGGTVEKVDEWGKRRLAYEIQKVREGVYTIISFNGDSNTPIELEKRLRIMENVLRYLITRQDA